MTLVNKPTMNIADKRVFNQTEKVRLLFGATAITQILLSDQTITKLNGVGVDELKMRRAKKKVAMNNSIVVEKILQKIDLVDSLMTHFLPVDDA